MNLKMHAASINMCVRTGGVRAGGVRTGGVRAGGRAFMSAALTALVNHARSPWHAENTNSAATTRTSENPASPKMLRPLRDDAH